MIYNKKIDKKSLKYMTKGYDSDQIKSIFDISDELADDYHNLLHTKLTNELITELLVKLGFEVKFNFDMLIGKIEYLKNSSIEEKVRFFYELNHKNEFNNVTYSLSVILFNYLLIQDHEFPIIMYPNIARHIMQTFNETPIQVYRILIQKLINHSISISRKQNTLSIDQIKRAILNNKEELVNLFGIKEIGIYGSYATNKIHEYSDIDFWIISEKEIDMHQVKKLLEFIVDHRSDVKLITFDEKNDDKIYRLIQIY